jgi:hypothetical protein
MGAIMKRDSSSVEAYRSAVEGAQSEMLETLREIILSTVPGTEETLQHGMLGYPGLANLGAQKHYVALYVMPEVLARHRDAFAGISCGKSCLRFRKPEQIDRESLRSLLVAVRKARLEG